MIDPSLVGWVAFSTSVLLFVPAAINAWRHGPTGSVGTPLLGCINAAVWLSYGLLIHDRALTLCSVGGGISALAVVAAFTFHPTARHGEGRA